MHYVYTWAGDALESQRTTLSISFILQIGKRWETIKVVFVKSCLQVRPQPKSIHLMYLSSTISIVGTTINYFINDLAPQADFHGWLVVDSTCGCLLCCSGAVSGWWKIHDMVLHSWIFLSLGGFGASQVFIPGWCSQRPVKVQGIILKTLN